MFALAEMIRLKPVTSVILSTCSSWWQFKKAMNVAYFTQPVTEANENSKVTLYVVPGCPLCARARAWLESHAIEYTERDAAKDFGALRAMYKLTKQNLVPVFEAKGRALVRPSEDDLAALLLS